MSALANINPFRVLSNTLFGSESYQSLAFRTGDAVAKSGYTYLALKITPIIKEYMHEMYQQSLRDMGAMGVYNSSPESTSLKKIILSPMLSSSKNIFLTTIIALGIINIPVHILNPGEIYNSFKSRALLTGLIVLTTYALHEMVPKISPETTLLSSITTGLEGAGWMIENVAWPISQIVGNLAYKTIESTYNIYSWING